MSYLEESYLNKISGRDGIVKKRDGLWNCSCPYCGDSKTDKRKKRGFFHYADDGELIYSCRNCGSSVHFSAFLEKWHPNEHLNYRLDKFKSSKKIEQKIKQTKLEEKKKPPIIVRNVVPKKTYLSIDELPKIHIARQYIHSRKLTNYSMFGYTENFARYVDEMSGGNPSYARVPKDARIIIPINSPSGELWGFQGRAIGKSDLRYVTIKLTEDFCKVFGLDKYDSTQGSFMLEGPFDATFFPNCLAMCGSSLDKKALDYINVEKTIVVYDNEPRNKEIVKKYEETIDMGFKIYIPKSYTSTASKDINDMYKDGVPLLKIAKDIIDNSYSGIEAKLRMQMWKKVE